MQAPSFKQLDPKQISQALTSLLDQFRHDINQKIAIQVPVKDMLATLDEQGHTIERFWSPCTHLKNVLGTQEWRDCYRDSQPLLTNYDTFVHQNLSLFQLIEGGKQDDLSLEQQKMRTDFLLNCRLSGINLGAEERARVETIFKRLHELSEIFENHVLDSQEKFQWKTSELSDLAGIPTHIIANAKQQDGTYQLSLDQPTYFAILTYAQNPRLRQIFFKAYNTRASDKSSYDHQQFDNTPIIQEILKLRQELAELIGMQDYLAYSLSSKMAKTQERVRSFLDDLAQAILPVAKQDMETLQAFAQEQGFQSDLAPWDLAYFSNLRQQSLFAIDQEALRVYFPLGHVMQAINQLLMALYQIHLQPQTDLETWHPEVEVYALKQGEKTLGLLYCDWFSRQGKRGGAWMDTLQSHTKNTKPIATLTCNFARPAPGELAGLTHDELTTLLHELGHCLHHLLSEAELFSVSGVHGVEWDAVELPSQWMENWGWQSTWVNIFSKHMQTGEPLPEAVFKQMLAAKNDMVGLFLLRQWLFASYDIRIHQESAPLTAEAVHQQYHDLLTRYAVWPIDSDQRFPQAFGHVFAGGYAAGYYSYLWAEVLAADVFSWFEANLSQMAHCGQALRAKLLAKGGSVPALSAFKDLMGREPRPEALLKHYGLAP